MRLAARCVLPARLPPEVQELRDTRGKEFFQLLDLPVGPLPHIGLESAPERVMLGRADKNRAELVVSL